MMEQITLDMIPNGYTPTAHISQYDEGRHIRFNLQNINLAGSETVTLKIRKTNGELVTKTIENHTSYVEYVSEKADAYDGAGVVTETASGAIATFETNMVDVLQEVKCEINATGGNGTPDNPNPINGYTEANITRCGVNLYSDIFSEYRKPFNYYLKNIPLKIGTSYTLRATLKDGGTAVSGCALGVVRTGEQYTEFGEWFVVINTAGNVFTTKFTVDSTFTSPKLAFYVANETQFNSLFENYEILLVEGTDTTYHPYTGNTYTIAFGQTVYGGVLDVTRGKLHVTTARLDLSDLNYSYNTTAGVAPYYYASISGVRYEGPFFSTVYNSKCNIYTCTKREATAFVDKTYCFDGSGGNVSQIQIKDLDYTDAATFKASLTGAYIIYELATPFDIDLTPVQIEALLGVNNVWHDGNGDTEVKYLYNA